MIYLATPYTDSNPRVEEERYLKACELATILAKHSIPCYIPIAFWTPIAQDFDLPRDAEFWTTQNYDLLLLCSELWIVQMEGWKRSRGIEAEREYFSQVHGSGRIFYLDPFEIPLACEQYHERRDLKRDALVKTALTQPTKST